MRHHGRGRRWRAWAAGLALTFALTVVPAGPTAGVSSGGGVTRVAGPERVATAVAASRAAWPGGSDTAVVTTAAGFADAVAAAPLAAALGAPVLLTDPAVLPAQATEELARLGAGDVVVVGGRAAVGDPVVAALRDLPQRPRVARVAGADRYETAAMAAARAGAPGGPVAVASGASFPDALAAAGLGLPLLLVARDHVPAATADALQRLAPSGIRIVGGTASVSEVVALRLRLFTPDVTRIAGAGRYGTAAAALETAANRADGPLALVAVSGEGFADGLSAGALAGRLRGAVLLVPPRRLTDELDALLRRLAPRLGDGVVLGGAAAVGPVTAAEVAAALAGRARPAFAGSWGPLPPDVAQRMTGGSWRPGCPVPLEQLALLRLNHWGFDGALQDGRLVVAREVADDVLSVFARLFEAGFPLERVALVDDYGADDDASMAANNTSGFNCRTVAGTARWSEHAYGTALDVNPVQNPYVRGDEVAPPAGAAYLDRSDVRPGMAVRPGPLVEAFAAVGWGWGGDWQASRDYQHFSASGR